MGKARGGGDGEKQEGEKRTTIKRPIRLIELFAGYGSQAMALRNIGADFERYRVVEFENNVLNR